MKNTIDILVENGYKIEDAFIINSEPERYEVILNKNGYKVTLLTDEPLPFDELMFM